MPLVNRYAQRITLASFTVMAALAGLALTTRAQDPTQEKPATEKSSATSPAQSPSPQKQRLGTELDRPEIIFNTDLITFNVTVTDSYGRYVTGLGKDAFTVFDNKEQQKITFFSDADSPLSLGVIFDVSGSMGGGKVLRARNALAKFIQTSHDSDEYFLIAFNSSAHLLLDKTRDGNAVLDKVTYVETKSQTALYDACYLGVEKVQRGTHNKRALLLISDGQDNDSRYTFNELRKLLKESDVALYAIGILSGSDAGSSLGMEGQGILDELAGVTGGKAFFPRSAAEMDDIFEQIALELRHQYSIGYKPEPFINDGKWHRVKVKVARSRGLPPLFVRAKEGYFASARTR